ncbi:hypothetical protein G647_06167 [Cladophialophora carrionii CBS 160.54]|uniref:Kelch repeat protein n=1 Tax=Cladophialophora carrionii CBS 160.54 TaxID=1279043 RepID=V9D609_9EURO|nr:uncharacterized protein G647_06167 [Cladophialophora carrionii CBS 160.54]ETI22096.1 hypothetical protein G647_06167 [Cladophialophora carrionii CBS 160.54]
MPPTATWTKICESDALRRSSQTLTVVNGAVYIFGGELRPREPVESSVYRIPKRQDADIDTFLSASADNAPQARVGATSTALHGKIYVFSGRGGVAVAPIEENGAFWVLDTTAKVWSQVLPRDPASPRPAGRSYHAMTNDGQDTIFVHAGCPEKGRLSDLWAFNVVERTWRELPAAPAPDRGGTSIAYTQGKLYRMNGFDGKTEQGGALDVFDPQTNSWQTVGFDADGNQGPGPRSVSCLLSVVVDNQPCLITMFGEHDPSSLGHQGAGKMLDDVWIFAIHSQKWKKLTFEGGGEKPCPRGWFDADVAGETEVVIHGGLAESNQRLGDMWLLDLGVGMQS